MQHQVDTDELNQPIYLNLELLGGSLIIKDHQNEIIYKTIGNPSKPGRPNNQEFQDMEEAYQWFLTTRHATRLDQEEDTEESGD